MNGRIESFKDEIVGRFIIKILFKIEKQLNERP